MNNRALTLALLMAGLAVYFMWSYVSSVESSTQKKFGTEILALVAKRDIKEMETVNDTAFEVKRIPKGFLEPSAISFNPAADEQTRTRDIKQLTGQIAVVPIKKGEQITFNKLSEPNIRTGLAPQVAPGRRAVAVDITEKSSASKLVKPGDRVDVIAVIDGGGGKESKIAKVLLQDVVVLSVGRFVTNNAPRTVELDAAGGTRVRTLAEDYSFASVTLEVDPKQAQSLSLVQSSGENLLMLALRNNDDTDRVSIPAVMLQDILAPDEYQRMRAIASQGGRR